MSEPPLDTDGGHIIDVTIAACTPAQDFDSFEDDDGRLYTDSDREQIADTPRPLLERGRRPRQT